MINTCPTCAAADETAAVRKALLDDVRPLDRPTRALLSMPPEPGRTGTAATVLFFLAGLTCLLALRALVFGHGGGSSDPAYQLGYRYGGFFISAVLLCIGLAVRSDRRSHRADTTGQWPHTSEQWFRLQQVWEATWLCRRCHVAFIPAAALRPGLPASAAVPFAHFSQWTSAVAQQESRPGTP